MHLLLRSASAAAVLAVCSTAVAQEPPLMTPPTEASRAANGVAHVVLALPSGKTAPTLEDHVTIEYTGWTATGEVLDSTAKHPDSRTFPLSKVFTALQQNVSAMRVGEKRRIWMPAEVGPNGAAAVFDVELVEISRPLDAPEDVAAPPADAEKSASGLAWKVLKAGSGEERPNAKSFVVVHYSGWTTDGRLFDSSFNRGEPGYFRLNQVIPGWREAMQMMLPGERRRIWIPEKLAYRGQRGMPQGMLVFDVELVRFR